jgi:hypothetical protein
MNALLPNYIALEICILAPIASKTAHFLADQVAWHNSA